MGIILTFIVVMAFIVIGMIIMPVIGEAFKVLCGMDEDDKEEEEES